MNKLTIAFVIVFIGLLLTVVIAKPQKLDNDNIVFNTNTLKIHKLDCEWAKKCTKNCVKTTRSKAYEKGGTACKVCGG